MMRKQILQKNHEIFNEEGGIEVIMGPISHAFKTIKEDSIEMMLELEDDEELAQDYLSKKDKSDPEVLKSYINYSYDF